MKETDRKAHELAEGNTIVGEWKGDASDKFRVNPDGSFTVWGENAAGLYNQELRLSNVWHGDIWFDMSNSNVDFNGA